MKKVFLLVGFLFSFLSFAQESMSTLDLSTKLVQGIRANGAGQEMSEADMKLLKQLNDNLQKDVVSEIEAEAKAANLDRDSYIENAESFESFVSKYENSVSQVESLTDAEKLILLTKMGLRFQIQQNIRFIPEGHFQRMEKIQTLFGILAVSLGMV